MNTAHVGLNEHTTEQNCVNTAYIARGLNENSIVIEGIDQEVLKCVE